MAEDTALMLHLHDIWWRYSDIWAENKALGGNKRCVSKGKEHLLLSAAVRSLPFPTGGIELFSFHSRYSQYETEVIPQCRHLYVNVNMFEKSINFGWIIKYCIIVVDHTHYTYYCVWNHDPQALFLESNTSPICVSDDVLAGYFGSINVDVIKMTTVWNKHEGFFQRMPKEKAFSWEQVLFLWLLYVCRSSLTLPLKSSVVRACKVYTLC